jgi:hypothetical protein
VSEQITPPKFDSQNYSRPNDGWICGRAAQGEPCPLGPDRRGRCQATAGCVPSLETMPGETKGRWRCNRPSGKCESGPLPDGSCCRPIPKCAPVPTLRTIRGRVNRAVIVFTCAALLVMLGIPQLRNRFINPGPLSTAHSSPEFAMPHGVTNNQSCSACHSAGNAGPHGILSAALHAEPRPWLVSELLTVKAGTPRLMDDACQKCHVTHAFHQANTSREAGCAFCHQEHQGAGRIANVNDGRCGLCHAQASVMAAAAEKGATMPANAFAADRPKRGFTKVIHSFATDHPEFRTAGSNFRDPDTLKFNHQLHLNGPTIPALSNGNKLDCAFCHEPDAVRTLMRPVRFEKHCQVCHSLQFDPQTPELTLPHSEAGYVSAFLHSLPQQYLELARRQGITELDQRRKFAESKLAGLRAQLQPGEDFEQRVFFSNDIVGPVAKSGSVEGTSRAVFPGCAYCHEVKSGVEHGVEIAKPMLAERWLKHSRFEHGKHSSISCTQCHAAQQSKDTADVLLPLKKNCVNCHSPQGGVTDTCVTCHSYHKQSPIHPSTIAAKIEPPN